MKRIHLFEVEDFQRFPRTIRDAMTNYLAVMHRLLGTSQYIAQLADKALGSASRPALVDLCSGGGGPMIDVWCKLKSKYPQLTLTLTDLYPNRQTLLRIERLGEPFICYRKDSVDATCVDASLAGMRTMVCSMHHMRPHTAKQILADAARNQQPILVFEISDNAQPIWLGWLALPVGFLLTFLLMPMVRPVNWRSLLFTYLIPIVPLCIGWDGAVSNMRTYTQQDWNELLAELPSNTFQWQVGTIKHRVIPGSMIYLLGTPQKGDREPSIQLVA